MKQQDRRHFLKSATSLAGALVLPNLALGQAPKLQLPADPDSEPFWEAIKDQFEFEQGLKYFNNASLGPSPIVTRQATHMYRDTLDAFPSKYMWGAWKEEKEAVRTQVAKFFSCYPEEIALIHNTTEGMNLVARSLNLQPGDEVILGDHEHPSGTVPWEVWQKSQGIELIRPEMPLNPQSVEEIVEVYRKAVTPNTKVISMCHMVNTNGTILPVKEVSQMAHKRGILVAVDGAQAAGMLAVDLHELECDFYAASAHKWLFSPKGVGIFYAREESQHLIKPLIVARGHEDESIRRFENYNTRNLPEVLGLGSALGFLQEIGPSNVQKRYFELKSYFRSAVENNPKFRLKTPGPDSLSSAIQVVELVGVEVAAAHKRLGQEFHIDCRPMTSFNLNGLRLSLALYITKRDLDDVVRILNVI